MIYLFLTCITLIATSIAWKLWWGLAGLSRVLTLETEWSPNRKRTPTTDTLSGLSAIDRREFVRRGREATLFDVRRSVRQADPVMPGDLAGNLHFKFYNRAN